MTEASTTLGNDFLKLQKTGEDLDCGCFEIVKQPLRKRAFCMGIDCFQCDNGIHIYSTESPKFDPEQNVLSVRGENIDFDFDTIFIEADKLPDVKFAVEQYNKEMQKRIKPTKQRLYAAKKTIKKINKDFSESIEYKNHQINIANKLLAPEIGARATEMFTGLIRNMFSVSLETPEIEETPNLSIWGDPQQKVFHVIARNDEFGSVSMIFPEKCSGGNMGDSPLLLTATEIDTLFDAYPIIFLAACCYSKVSFSADIEDVEQCSSVVKRRRRGRMLGRSFWKV